MFKISEKLMSAFEEAAENRLKDEIVDKASKLKLGFTVEDVENVLSNARAIGFIHRHHLIRFCLEVPSAMHEMLINDPYWQNEMNYPGRDGDHRLELILAHLESYQTEFRS